MTPFETRIATYGYRQRVKTQLLLDQAQAYDIEALARTKRLPGKRAFMGLPPLPQSPKKMSSAVRGWLAHLERSGVPFIHESQTK